MRLGHAVGCLSPSMPFVVPTREQGHPYPVSRLLIIVGFALAAVLLLGTALTIIDMREKAWERASASARTLLESITRTVERDIELYDLSLRSVAERMQNPAFEMASPELRYLTLFDRAATAKGYGAIFVLDGNGNAFIESGQPIPRVLNGADRAYFQAHRTRDAGLFVGQPWRTRISGREMIPLSRRFSYADGAFAGVIVGAIELAYFQAVFARLNQDANLRVTMLFEGEATGSPPRRAIQNPVAPVLSDAVLVTLTHTQRATFVEPATETAPGQLHAAQTVGTLPMRIVVSIPTPTIDAAWQPRAGAMLAIVGTLTLALVALLFLLRRELGNRSTAEAKLAKLAHTDALTGLSNRRHFDQALSEIAKLAAILDVGLLLIDADRFKAYNDLYGHPAGDQVLIAVAGVLTQTVARHGGQAFRIGGEEFAIAVSGRNEARTLSLAESVRRGVEELGLSHKSGTSQVVTVSVGVFHNSRFPLATAAQWLSLADQALYVAKHAGRNRVQHAGAAGETSQTVGSATSIV